MLSCVVVPSSQVTCTVSGSWGATPAWVDTPASSPTLCTPGCTMLTVSDTVSSVPSTVPVSVTSPAKSQGPLPSWVRPSRGCHSTGSSVTSPLLQVAFTVVGSVGSWPTKVVMGSGSSSAVMVAGVTVTCATA